MRRRLTTACVCAALVVTPIGAQEPAAKRVITHEDVFLMKRVGAPVVSPDGRWAAFPVTEPAYESLAQSSDIWIVPTDGSAPARKLTDTRAAETGLAWSPDGTRLAFSSRPEDAIPPAVAGALVGAPGDGTQIFVLDVPGGGEPRTVTSMSTGARLPKWRPDGKAILFNADVSPGARTDEDNQKAAAERRTRKWNARVYEGFPIRDWDRWLPERKPSLWVQELEGTAPARQLLADAEMAAQPGFGGQLGSGSESISTAWADDTTVYFAATTNRDQAAYADVIQSLWRVDTATGKVALSAPVNASYSDPAVDAANLAVYARVEPLTDRTYNASVLMRVSAADGTVRHLNAGLDRSAGAFVVAPGGKAVYFLAEDTGRQKLYAAHTDGSPAKEVGTLTAGSYSSFHVAGPAETPVAVAVWESAVNPPELVRVDLQTGARTLLTSFNTERAAQIDLPPLQEFWFTSAKARKIHNFVVLPPTFDPAKQYPLFVVIHGGPHGQWMDQWVLRWNYHLLGAPGYVVLLTNFTGSTGFGEVFAQNIQGDPLETPGQEILQAVDEALKKYPFIDGTRMAAGGASYGGHLTNWLAVTTTRFKALVSHAGLFDQVAQWTTSDITHSRERNMGGPVWDKLPLWQTQNPIMKAPALKTPMLVTAGERDFRVPINNTLQLWSVLQRQKVPGRLIVFPDENHWILRGENSRFFYAEVHAWLKKWL